MRWTALVLAVVAVAAQGQEGAPGAARKQGTFYAVTCHGGDEALAEQALSVVEAVWPIVAATFGVPDATPARPLEVHLYRTPELYIAADDALTGGKFRRNLAMSHWDSRSAHVALQPPCRDEALRALGLPPLTATMLAWEATHLARYELCPNFRDQPEWFGDGLASWVATQVVAARRPAPAEAVPFWASDIVRVQRLLEARKLPPVRSILSDEVADLDLQDRYATRCVFFMFAAAGREKLAKVADAVRRTRGGNGYAAAVLAEALAAFGGADEPFAAFVRGLQPQWEEVYRSLWTAGTEWCQIAFPDANAIAWRRDPVAGGGFSAKGGLRILPGEGRQLNLLFARGDEGFYSLAFVADQGFVLFDYRAKTEEWVRVGAGDAPGLRLGVSTDFAVSGRGSKLEVTLDGKSWTLDLPRPLPDRVAWGLGAQAKSAGLWQRVAVGPAGP
ncbi:MAG TPA: hypothetical protein VFY93_05465 [Planctomycetota bacterium]|nr:hypothetical protein [Planctomycetota bacterium]